MEEKVKRSSIFGGAEEEKSVRTLTPEILKKVNEIISNNQKQNSTSENWITPEMVSEVQEQLSGLQVTITLKPEWITEQLVKDIDLRLQTCGGRSTGDFDKYWIKSINNVLGRAAFESEFLDSYTHTDGGRPSQLIVGGTKIKLRDEEALEDGVYVKQLESVTHVAKVINGVSYRKEVLHKEDGTGHILPIEEGVLVRPGKTVTRGSGNNQLVVSGGNATGKHYSLTDLDYELAKAGKDPNVLPPDSPYAHRDDVEVADL